MGSECSTFYKRIAELTAAKIYAMIMNYIRIRLRYAMIMNYIRIRLRFAMLRSTLIGIRGRANKNMNAVSLDNVSLNIMPVVNSYECRYLIEIIPNSTEDIELM